MSDVERIVYEEAKLTASCSCTCGDWHGGGTLRGLLYDLEKSARDHLSRNPDHKITMTIAYDADPHMVSLEGERQPWSWEREAKDE